MISFVVVSHGPLARALIRSVEMVIGRHPELYAIEIMPEDSADEYRKKLETLLKSLLMEGEVIILSDFPLGTPFNTAIPLMQQYGLRHLTGVNIPMLFALLDPTNQKLSLDELCRTAVCRAEEELFFVNKKIKEENP